MSEPAPPHSPAPPWTRRALVLASALLLSGLWIVLDAAGVAMPSLARHWPLFVILGGVASLADYTWVSRRPGALGLGVFGVTLGVDLYLLTLRELSWRRVGLWGPGIYLAVGLGCLAAWGADRQRSPRLLVVGGAALGLAITFWARGAIPMALFWGGLLLLLGVAIVVSVLRRAR
ncbi:MAG TPA: hypothetical protein VGV61_19955 [Thermoanaerobaculia bacterium]|nr:hypothetical protein [Thermoanaerobaculia bacterium]